MAEAENVVITAAAGGKTAEYTIKTIRKVLHGYEQDENGVYLIYNRQGFSNCFYDIENKSFKLMTDLDFRGVETKHAGEIFDGTFDGNGHIIREYKVDDSPSVHYGFVSVLGGTIMNVVFDTPVIRLQGITDKETYFGVVAGENNGTIKNVSINNAAVELQQVYADLFASAGLITGQSTGVIDNCTVDTGSLVIKFATSKTVLGGITGINKGKIISSAANNINLTNPANSVVDYITATGGIAGVFSSGSYVKGSYAAGQITADDYAGGIAGVVEQGAADVSASIFVGLINPTGANTNTGLDYGSYTSITNEEEVYVKSVPAESTPKIKSPVTKIIRNNEQLEDSLAEAARDMNKLLNKDVNIHYLFKAGENEYEDSPSYGCPQVTVCFKIVTGQYKGQRLFWSTNIFGQYAHLSINNINEFLESLDSGIDVRFEDFKQYADMLKAIFDEISERYEYQLAFGEGTSKKGSKFKTYNIVQKFDKA